jgi:hypothetical protein
MAICSAQMQTTYRIILGAKIETSRCQGIGLR